MADDILGAVDALGGSDSFPWLCLTLVARLIGYVLGGRAGERLTTRIGLPVSNDTP